MTIWLKRLAAALILGMAAATGWAVWLQASGNFHAVATGALYRSAQPAPEDLHRWTQLHGLRSVVNLRGPSDSDWYRDEIAASRELGLTHADFPMRENQRLDPEQAARLIALIDSLPKPVLIHCKAGADRTGLAAALYLAMRGSNETAAESQLSFRYGHVALPVSAAWAMDQSWEEMERVFGFES